MQNLITPSTVDILKQNSNRNALLMKLMKASKNSSKKSLINREAHRKLVNDIIQKIKKANTIK